MKTIKSAILSWLQVNRARLSDPFFLNACCAKDPLKPTFKGPKPGIVQGILVLMTSAAVAGAGIEPRTDINPALQYYQAYIVAPDLRSADHDFLFTNEWRGQKLSGRFGELVAGYDNQFKLVRLAARQTVPCDWGLDWSSGPGTLLPHLSHNKGIALATRYRVMWHLKQGRPIEARDDLLAALALARNSSRDRTLISALVQIAMENILCSIVAENFYQLSPEILRQIADGFEAAPPRGTMAECVPAEKAFFHDWLMAKVLALQKEYPGDNSRVMTGIQELVANLDGGDESQTNRVQTSLWDQMNKASGGRSEGIIELLHNEEPVYQKLASIMALPLAEYQNQITQFRADIHASSNPFVTLLFPAAEKCRQKEFAIQVKLAMVRAAVEYKLRGEAGLKSVRDPAGSGPFGFERFVFEGVDRGFELKSPYDGRGFPEAVIFIEKDGPPFLIDGQHAGRASSK